MATSAVIYERGTTYVTNISGGKTCYGLVGEIWIGGLCFETLERFSLKDKVDFIHLAKGDYAGAVMYWDTKRGRVLNPWNGAATSKQLNNILVHRGSRPSHFEGCIGPGFLESRGTARELSYSPEAMEVIWGTAGGAPGDRTGWTRTALKVHLTVKNAFPDRATLTPHTG